MVAEVRRRPGGPCCLWCVNFRCFRDYRFPAEWPRRPALARIFLPCRRNDDCNAFRSDKRRYYGVNLVGIFLLRQGAFRATWFTCAARQNPTLSASRVDRRTGRGSGRNFGWSFIAARHESPARLAQTLVPNPVPQGGNDSDRSSFRRSSRRRPGPFRITHLDQQRTGASRP